MSVLITGGCGFVGAFAAKRFAAAGEDVVALDVTPSPAILDLVLTSRQRQRVRVEAGDLLDLPLLLRLARRHGVDRILHLGYVITLPTRANPTLAQSVNVTGTNHVFELALAIGAPRIVIASTIDVFGPKSVGADGVVRNDAPYDPQGIYGACKLLNEVAARDYARDFGLDPVTLRIPAAFGAGITRSWGRFIPNLIRDLVEGRTGQAPTLTKVMPWAYVEDIADALFVGFSAPPTVAAAYTLPGTERGVDEVIAIIRDQFPGAAPEPIEWPDFGTVPSYDGSEAQRYLGWTPRFGLAEGLRRIADYYRARSTGAVPE